MKRNNGVHTKQPTYLFVYGTLRKGQTNRHVLEDNGLIETDNPPYDPLRAVTNGRLYEFNRLPYLIDTETPPLVKGELVRLKNPEKAFEILDTLEGPTYKRKLIQVKDIKSNQHQAWAYVASELPDNSSLIQSGDWLHPFYY